MTLPRPSRARIPRNQRGAATLIVTLMLFLALALLTFGINRRLLIEQRTAANHARAGQAFEAAEAGLDWAQGMLNDARRVGADCRASDKPEAASFRTRYLKIDRASGVITPASTTASCARTAAGWSCHCDGRAAATDVAQADAVHPAFTVTLQPGPQAGSVRIVAASHVASDATARAEMTLALHAGLRRLPTAAITASDATTIAAERFFSTFFGVEKSDWRDQPAVARIACTGGCGRDVQRAIEAGHDLIWIDGDASFSGPLTLGSRERPVVLVADGALRMDNGVALYGASYARSTILGSADDAVFGALLSETFDAGSSASSAYYDIDVLTALSHQTGSFVRLPGSWRDY